MLKGEFYWGVGPPPTATSATYVLWTGGRRILPDMPPFCQLLAKLHHDSMLLLDAPPPPHEFRFDVVHLRGEHVTRTLTWCKTWEKSFLLHFQAFGDQERESARPQQGSWPNFSRRSSTKSHAADLG